MYNNKILTLFAGILLLAAISIAYAVEDTAYLNATPKQMQWWREARFGMFVHWGPVSLKGTEISWSRGSGIPREEYDNLYKQFNPVNFDPDEWVRTAKAAGAKYLVFTTKHHDGFCMFDSKLTDYKITNSPYGKDITAQVAEACHRQRLRIGFYYSPTDWHHPDFGTENRARYAEYMHGQLRELCTNYGKVSIIWFDSKGIKSIDSPRLFKMIRELQPGILINDRGGLPGDYDTPEQRVGGFQNNRPWESCMTIGDQWSWKPNDEIKSLKQIVDTLVGCAGGDGNLLLNVGPMADGRIEPEQVARLKEVGAWLKKNGETIKGTRGGPLVPSDAFVSMHKGDTIYLHILKWPDGQEEITLLPIKKRIVSSKLLTGGKAEVVQSKDGISISVAPEYRNPLDTIVALKLDSPASDILPIREPTVTAGKPVKASSVLENDIKTSGPANAVDEDLTTVWNAEPESRNAWLEVDAGRFVTIRRALIREATWYTRAFELQYEEAGEWRTFLKGERIGPNFTATFEPVTARRFRLKINEANGGPSIREFQLMPPKN